MASATETQAPSVARATLLVLLSACCFASIPIFTVLATRTGVQLATVLAWRYLIACVGFIVVARSIDRLRVPRGALRDIVLLGGGGQAVIGATELSALRWIPAATMVFLFYTYPAWVALFSAVRGTERLTTVRVVALLLSLGGIVVMVGAPGAADLDPRGVGLALGGAVFYALYIPLLARLQTGTSPYAVSAWAVLTAGILFVVVGTLAPGFVGAFTFTIGATAWGCIIGLALLSTTTAFLLFLRGLSTLGPVRTAIISTVEPFGAALLQTVVLGQPLGSGTIAGGAMIAAAVMLLQRSSSAAVSPAHE
ncbi:MAG: DMT family transporter [Gemmatimonadota bacterium]|nr:DMT family transporter [Gemmatimonadota bacterium]